MADYTTTDGSSAGTNTRAQRLAYAQARVAAVEAAIAGSEAGGVVSVTTDGLTVQFQPEGALKELDYWRKQVDKLSRTRGGVRRISLGGAHD